MTVSDWLIEATQKLSTAGIGTARLDALVLLEDATSKDRAYLLAHPETRLQGPALQRLNEWIERRTKHEPLAYIREKTEFYGRDFIVNKTVLEPRPESETMITLLKELYEIAPCIKVQSRKASARHLDLSADKAGRSGEISRQARDNILIVDIGTGSGSLAITAKLEIPDVKVAGTDIDASCLIIARQNAKKHGVNVEFLEGDLLEPLLTNSHSLTIILANLPYVPDNHTINQAATMEPRLAIFGGADGLDLYRRLFEQFNRGNTRAQFVLTESLPNRHKELAKIAKQAGFEPQKTDDFIQVFRAEK